MNNKKNTAPQFSQNDTLRSIQIFLWALKEYIYNGLQYELTKAGRARNSKQKQFPNLGIFFIVEINLHSRYNQHSIL